MTETTCGRRCEFSWEIELTKDWESGSARRSKIQHTFAATDVGWCCRV